MWWAGGASAGGRDVFLSRLDAAGSVIFSRRWGTAADDVAAALAQAPGGDIYAALTSDAHAQGCAPGQALLLKWNESATQAEPRVFDTCGEDRATSLTIDLNGTVFLGGATRGSFVDATGRGGTDIFLMSVQITN